MKHGSRLEAQPTGSQDAIGAATSLWYGALEMTAITAAFVVTGLAWAAIAADLAARDSGAEPASFGFEVDYRGLEVDYRESVIWLVDGYNVLHVGVLGGRDRSAWWTESHRHELIEQIRSFDDPTAEIWVVFDGRDEPQEPPRRSPRCVFATSADDWLIDRVRRTEDPSLVAVVTADRQVAGRARHRGARIVAPKDFLARCNG